MNVVFATGTSRAALFGHVRDQGILLTPLHQISELDILQEDADVAVAAQVQLVAYKPMH